MSLSSRPAVTIAYILAVGITIASFTLLWLRPVLSDESLEFGEDYATFHGAALLVAEGRVGCTILAVLIATSVQVLPSFLPSK